MSSRYLAQPSATAAAVSVWPVTSSTSTTGHPSSDARSAVVPDPGLSARRGAVEQSHHAFGDGNFCIHRCRRCKRCDQARTHRPAVQIVARLTGRDLMKRRIDIIRTALEGLHAVASTAKRAQQPERHGRFAGAGTWRRNDETWRTGGMDHGRPTITSLSPGTAADRRCRTARCRGNPARASTSPTRISAVRSMLVFSTSPTMVPSVARIIRSSGQLARNTTATGQVLAIGGNEFCDGLVERMNGEMNRKRRAGRGERGQAFGFGHRRGPSRGPGQHDRLSDFGQRQFPGQCSGGGGEGRNARRNREGDIERFEPSQLFAKRAPDRQIAGMEARDILAFVGRPLEFGDDLVERHRRRIDDARTGRAIARAAPWARASLHTGRPDNAR